MTILVNRGKAIQEKLLNTLREIRNAAHSGHSRPVIWGVTPNGQLVGGLTMPEFLTRGG